MGCAGSIDGRVCLNNRFSQVLPGPEDADGGHFRTFSTGARQLSKTKRVRHREVQACKPQSMTVQDKQISLQSLSAGQQLEEPFDCSCTSSTVEYASQGLNTKLRENTMLGPTHQHQVNIDNLFCSGSPAFPCILNQNVSAEPIEAITLNSYEYEPEAIEFELGFPIAPCAPLHRQHLRRLQQSLDMIEANPVGFKHYVLSSRFQNE